MRFWCRWRLASSSEMPSRTVIRLREVMTSETRVFMSSTKRTSRLVMIPAR